jgi:ketosteroid isomerase-like protein
VDRLDTRRLSLRVAADPIKARPRPERRLLQGLRPRRHHRSMTYQPDLEWTYLDPALQHPTPQVCHGRHELEHVLRHWAEHGLRAELDEVASGGELVMVGVRTPGVGAHHGRLGDDRAYSVFTVRDGRIVALRDCRDREEARRFAGIQS